MSIREHKKPFRAGAKDALPFLLMIIPFGMLYGVVATEAGLSPFQTMTMTTAVFAGASQFVTLQLLQDGTPALLAAITGITVNLRMAMYSASLTPHLGGLPLWQRGLAAFFMIDQAYAAAITRYAKEPHWSQKQKAAYYFGVLAVSCPFWMVGAIMGILLGGGIPPEYQLDFALPITFCAMIAPMLRGLPNIGAAFTAIVVVLLFNFLPYNLGLLVATLAGMIAGALLEGWSDRQKQKILLAQKDAAMHKGTPA